MDGHFRHTTTVRNW